MFLYPWHIKASAKHACNKLRSLQEPNAITHRIYSMLFTCPLTVSSAQVTTLCYWHSHSPLISILTPYIPDIQSHLRSRTPCCTRSTLPIGYWSPIAHRQLVQIVQLNLNMRIGACTSSSSFSHWGRRQKQFWVFSQHCNIYGINQNRKGKVSLQNYLWF